ncbi:uroporphyrinogen-III synthase [Neobacillus dielmonensis]|uniref:uroporphyrinogen-III synthase n=1 Tax=Neobacillus dielmonensis TaxID=1347369 RepID=UPI0005A69B63|nr:uroporphyrinogen-III synthase [Neobacillus dielmonensis]
MSNPLPLLDKKVLVPRGKGQAKSFSQLVKEYGGIPVEIPLIAFRPVEMNKRLQEVLRALETFDWLVFTSKVTVDTFFSFIDPARVKLPRIAVIGKKTAEELEKLGIEVAFVPSAYVAEAFVEEFLPLVGQGERVLIPKGNLAREYIADSLTEAGASVEEIIIYENYMPEESRGKLVKMLAEDQLDILLFTSPSTVDHFMAVVKENQLESRLNGSIIGCIGPVTEKKLLEYQLPVHVSPEEYTVKAMVESTIGFLEKHEGIRK